MYLEHRHSVLLQLYLHSQLNPRIQWIGQRQLQDETMIIEILVFGAAYIKIFYGKHLNISFRNCHHSNYTTSQWWLANVGSDNGLIPSDIQTVPKPMLNQVSVAIWRH